MDKEQIGQNFFIPMPVVLVGTQVSGKTNFMTVGWCSRANASPPMIVCGIGNHHHTTKGIAETKTFSVNIPSSNLIEKTDYCGIVSGEKTDKSRVFDVFYGSLKDGTDDPRVPGFARVSACSSCLATDQYALYRRNCRSVCRWQDDKGRETGFSKDRSTIPDDARQPLLDTRKERR